MDTNKNVLNTFFVALNWVIQLSLSLVFIIYFGKPAVETYLKYHTVITEEPAEYKDLGTVTVSTFVIINYTLCSSWNYFHEFGEQFIRIRLEPWLQNQCLC